MDILVGYGFGPLIERILQHYWYHLSIVARSGRYSGTLFKVHLEVTQGYPISPAIFSILVDAVNCHWVTLVEGEEAVTDGFRRVVQWLAAFFYAKDGLLA